jgi:hypothetical protein
LLQCGTAADADSFPISKGDIMDLGATPDLMHQILSETFAQLGAAGPMVRTLLLRDRHFVGQRFRCGGFHAVLLVGGGEIAFYDEGGTLLKTIRLAETDKKAAA